jgi:SNF2 family DNA or RNA helicase
MFEDADSEFTGFDAESWSDNYFHKQNPVFRREKMSTKLKYILDEVQGILSVKEKIVIVSQWTAMLDLIAIQLDNLSIAYQVINGNISANKRTDIVDDFNGNETGSPVTSYILSTNE